MTNDILLSQKKQSKYEHFSKHQTIKYHALAFLEVISSVLFKMAIDQSERTLNLRYL